MTLNTNQSTSPVVTDIILVKFSVNGLKCILLISKVSIQCKSLIYAISNITSYFNCFP